MPNSNEIDILAFEQDLRRTYERYIYTTNLISDQEPELQEAFDQRIREGFSIFNGPYVHCTPNYQHGDTLQRLIEGTADIQLSSRMSAIPEKQFDPSRPLYSHQVEALRILDKGRNLVVATGTGSGKTECFLLPIIDHILKNPGPGLRAIIIYPMNALADDQLGRLRKLLTTMPEVTFGRYTGDTPEHSEEEERPAEVVANENYTRHEIRDNPPHILLTNFAMLEYLMLRPRDSEIFEGNRLKFVVLDEAHTYSGAQGIEIALLMRRLREYLAGKEHNLQFILTSATLGDEDDATAKVVQFAKNISGMPFSEEDVLHGEIIDEFADNLTNFPDRDLLLRIGVEEKGFTAWGTALTDTNALVDKLNKSGIMCGTPTTVETSRLLFDLLSTSEPLNRIHKQCRRHPSTLGSLCKVLELPEDAIGMRAVQWLITLGAYARRSPDSAPLLPTRFHFFARGLSGASVCLAESCPGKRKHPGTNWSAFYLEDRNTCQECESKVLPLLTCVHCGLPACRVYLSDGRWQATAIPYQPPIAKVLTWESHIEEEEEQDGLLNQTVWICLKCGRYAEGTDQSPCPSDHTCVRLRIVPADGEGNLKRCPRCGGQSRNYPSVLRDFKSQENAPTAVLAETIIRNLPFDPEDPQKSELPANGRNLLVFSDARQRAAFFAPYLEQTTLETAYMGPLAKAIDAAEHREGRPASIEEVARDYVKEIERQSIVIIKKRDENGLEVYEPVPKGRLRSSDRTTARREAEILLFDNFTSSYRSKTTLPGTGIAAITFDFNDEERESIPGRLPEIFEKGEVRGWSIIHALLEVFLIRKAITLPDGISLRDILDPGPKMVTFHFALSGNRNDRQVIRWNPFEAVLNLRCRAVQLSRQVDIVARALNLDKDEDAAQLGDLITRIWDCFKDTMLLEAQGCPGEYQLDYNLIQVSRDIQWGMCGSCGRLSSLPNLEFCFTPGCTGTVKTLLDSDCARIFKNNHYRNRYMLPPLAITVKEHTAQLTNDCGKEYQRKFMAGEINVLSSSTTFEMGVDVGALKAVLMRNVPPTTSSYIQRAGRAGRRKDGISVALTFCRNMPHDQYNYQVPETIILGEIPAPYLNLRNEPLTQRHCNSLLLGYFLRSIQDVDASTLDRLTIEKFFLDNTSGSTLAERYGVWLSKPTAKDRMCRSLKAILPTNFPSSAEAVIDLSVCSLLSDGTSIFQVHVKTPLERFKEQLQEALEQMNIVSGGARTALARSAQALERLITQFKNERLIDFLSSSSWLPGYAFPQDVVKLLVRQADYGRRMRLERDREIGISEYAPGAEIVADGLLFSSGGIWFNSREPDIRQYARCPECRKIDTYLESERPLPNCSRCGTLLTGKFRSRFYIKPYGFTTLVTDHAKRPGRSRRPGARASEVFLLEGAAEEEFKRHSLKGITFADKCNGRLFLANSGYRFGGYYLCRRCGRGFPQQPSGRSHTTPWGTDCTGIIKRLDLAHEIRTDILQLRFQSCNPAPPPTTERAFWLSLTTAFLNGASDALNIDMSDLGGTYHGWSEESFVGELVVYDRIPGGAGHITRILEKLDVVLEAAYKRVHDCKCPDLEASCYACLRSYSNQFYWEELKRRPVIDWLGAILGKK